MHEMTDASKNSDEGWEGGYNMLAVRSRKVKCQGCRPCASEREKGESSAPEPAIKVSKGKRSCLLDAKKRSVHAKARGDSWEGS